MGRPLKIAKAQALLTLTDTTAATGVVTVSQTNLTDTYKVLAGMPFIPASTVGGLTAGTTYWILEVTGSSTFTVSATPIDQNVYRTAVSLTNTTGQSVVLTVGVVDAYFNNPATGAGYPAASASTYSVVGGNTAIYGKQVLAVVAISNTQTGTITTSTTSTALTGTGTDFANTVVNGTGVALTDGTFVGFITDVANATATTATLSANAAVAASAQGFVIANDENGFIVRQKGKTKYLVQGLTSGLVGACYTANSAGAALQPGQMNMTATYADSSTKLVQSLSDHNAEVFAGDGTLGQSNAVYVTFNSAAAADAANGQPYPLVTISNA